jgi:hypothetical protein
MKPLPIRFPEKLFAFASFDCPSKIFEFSRCAQHSPGSLLIIILSARVHYVPNAILNSQESGVKVLKVVRQLCELFELCCKVLKILRDPENYITNQ